jgi:hypothetical protein
MKESIRKIKELRKMDEEEGEKKLEKKSGTVAGL